MSRRPKHRPNGIVPEVAEAQEAIAAAYRRRDRVIREVYRERGISRRQLALAAGLSKPRIDQILTGE
jgi:hypothetical protein